jgi:hypothetical protein
MAVLAVIRTRGHRDRRMRPIDGQIAERSNVGRTEREPLTDMEKATGRRRVIVNLRISVEQAA